MTQPLFNSAHAALTFAFQYSGQQYDLSPMGRAMRGPTGSGLGLVGMDGAGQAGIIRAMVRRLGRLQEAIIVARFAPRTVPCCGCGSPKPSPEWCDAINVIQDAAGSAALSGQMSHRQLRAVIVERAFGGAASLAEMAERCEVHRHTASKHNGLILMWLRGRRAHPGKAAVPGVEQLALVEIEDALISAGLVGEDEHQAAAAMAAA